MYWFIYSFDFRKIMYLFIILASQMYNLQEIAIQIYIYNF